MTAQRRKAEQVAGLSGFPHAKVRFVLLLVALSLGGCASAPPERRVVSESVQVQLPPTQVFFYPNSGQSPEQQKRDRYECYLWAVKHSGFDPSQPQVASHVRVDVVPMPAPGHDTAVGAVTGAMLGAVVSRPRDTAEGAVIGAVAGALIGAASDASRVEQTDRIQTRYDRLDAHRASQLERRAQDYRRAMAACLEGRGYTVH